MENENLFQKEWEKLEATAPLPVRLNEVKEVDFSELKQSVAEQNPEFVSSIVSSLFAGDIYIIKSAFTKEFADYLKEKTHEHWQKSPSSFHKMLEGCPDFHRIIDAEAAKNYSIHHIKHSYYFFHWNDDPLHIFPKIMEKWRVLKRLGGCSYKEYEENTPDDGVVDRIQVVRYPPSGRLEPHVDPHKYQIFFINGHLSKRGVDYQQGGLYALNQSGEKVSLEDRVDIGDMTFAVATIIHGVDTIDPDEKLDWNKTDGRWFLGLYTNVSDIVQNRHTSRPTNIA